MSRFDSPEFVPSLSMSTSSRSVLRKRMLHVFVLDGPLNHTVESLLASSVTLTQKVGNCLLSASEVGMRNIVSVSTGELLRLGANVLQRRTSTSSPAPQR